ncbi:MAG: 1,4-alpha-glucan branching enzyme, partial [Lysobacterales bacterium]
YDQNIQELKELLEYAAQGQLAIADKDLEILQQFYDLHFSDQDKKDFVDAGTSKNAYEKLGAHPVVRNGKVLGTYFSVWAPNAQNVSVIGTFNEWGENVHELRFNQSAGVWYRYVPEAMPDDLYKFRVTTQDGSVNEKIDPYAFSSEYPTGDEPTRTASRISNLDFNWSDQSWVAQRKTFQSVDQPMSMYELHLGSWRKKQVNGEYQWMTYREIADELVPYLKEMNFTHLELMPVMEHDYYPSWGYQVRGFYSATSRYGSPEDLKYLIDLLHQNKIAVIMDWVPAHFASDAHGLSQFDGTELYSHENPLQGKHPNWGTRIFNYGRNEVKSFLISNAMFWFKEFHIDGMRVDAVSSMLFLNADREEGQWIPNIHGGPENLEAVAFLKDLNTAVHDQHPGVLMIAEESTTWEGITRSVKQDGLGFDMKWSMGWMNDTLEYLEEDPIHRSFKHNLLTMYPHYAFTENFLLPLSHDEVVHLKKSLLSKMPGDDWQQFANLRLLYSFMFAMPGKKLLFMGSELAPRGEWNPDHSLEWDLLEDQKHQGVQSIIKDLNLLYQQEPALHELDFHTKGFEWMSLEDEKQSVVGFIRRGINPDEALLVIFNLTPVERENYRVGLPWGGQWQQIFNSDNLRYGGSGSGHVDEIEADIVSANGRDISLNLTLPGLSMMVFKGRNPKPGPFIQLFPEGHVTKQELDRGVEASYRNIRGGYVEDGNKTVNEGDKVTFRFIANRPDLDGTRKVYMYSNRSITGQWQKEEVAATFIENSEGRAIYEYTIKARRKFEYAVSFEGEGGENEWIDASYGNLKIDVNTQFKGSAAYVAMEFAPLVKVGGQADVVYELPKAMAKRGNDVSVIIPHFKSHDYDLERHKFIDVDGFEVEIPFKQRGNVKLRAKTAIIDNIRVYILETEDEGVFARTYDSDKIALYDSILLSRGSLELLKFLGKKIDIVNSADHHTGLVSLYMRTFYQDFFNRTGSVFTIHNIAYQGQYSSDWFEEMGLEDNEVIRRLVTKNGQLNMMGVPAHVIKELGGEGNFVNTVSSSYAKEIRHTYFELDRLLRDIDYRFDGVLNGLDFEIWDPDTDKNIKQNYSIKDGPDKVIEARLVNKRDLQEILSVGGDTSKIKIKNPGNIHGSLTVGSDRLLVGVVSRIVKQKQIDIIAQLLEEMYNGSRIISDVDFVLNGTGDQNIEQQLIEMASDARKEGINMSVVFVSEYVQVLTHKILAAADLFIVPSDFEPSGLTQMQAMRYGAIPLVRKTGGLADTVTELGDERVGFVFDGVSRVYGFLEEDQRRKRENVKQLHGAIIRAKNAFQNNREEWKDLIRRSMQAENDWSRSLGDYMNIYAWLSEELNRDSRGGSILSGDVQVSNQEKVRLRVEAHSTDSHGSREVYLYSNRKVTGEWEKESVPTEYVGTVDGRDIYEIEVEARRTFEYTFVFEYEDGEQVWAKLDEGNPKVVVESAFKGNVAFVGMEFAPLIKVGGQGDVMYELPKALVESKKNVRVIIPYFKGLK